MNFDTYETIENLEAERDMWKKVAEDMQNTLEDYYRTISCFIQDMLVYCNKKGIPQEYDLLYDNMFKFVEYTAQHIKSMNKIYTDINGVEFIDCFGGFSELWWGVIENEDDNMDISPLYEYASYKYKQTRQIAKEKDKYSDKMFNRSAEENSNAKDIILRVREEREGE